MRTQFMLFLFFVFWWTNSQVLGEELVCQGDIGKETLINKYGILPKEARGEIQYCRFRSLWARNGHFFMVIYVLLDFQ